jgi:hypothetical protein
MMVMRMAYWDGLSACFIYLFRVSAAEADLRLRA